jgi:Tetracyclin repressor-like, C-terminal domain
MPVASISARSQQGMESSAEGCVRWSTTVRAALREPGPMSPSRVAETLAHGLAADPLFYDLLVNLHLEREVDLDRVVEIRRTSAAGEISLADAIEQALPALGRSGALNVLLAAYSLTAPLWQIAHPPQRLIDAFADEPELAPDRNLDFASALTQLLTATCVVLLSESAPPEVAQRSHT